MGIYLDFSLLHTDAELSKDADLSIPEGNIHSSYVLVKQEQKQMGKNFCRDHDSDDVNQHETLLFEVKEEKKDDKLLLLFGIVITKIVNKELEYQKKYIRDYINIAKDNAIRQDGCLVDRGAVAPPRKREDDATAKDDNDEHTAAVTKCDTVTAKGDNGSDR